MSAPTSGLILAGVMSSPPGPAPRRYVPPEIPDDFADPVEKASGVVTLPIHIEWSGPPRRYDLACRRDRIRVYELVLREGTAADVRWFIDIASLIDLWDELTLPRHVREAWARWLRDNLDVDLSC